MVKNLQEEESDSDDFNIESLLKKAAQKQKSNADLQKHRINDEFEVAETTHAPKQPIRVAEENFEKMVEKKKIKKDKKDKKDKEKKDKKHKKEKKRSKRDQSGDEDELIDQENPEEESQPAKKESVKYHQLIQPPILPMPHQPQHKVDPRTTLRQFSLTMVFPSSIVDNAQSMELKTYLVSQIAKAATLFCVNEIVVISDDKNQQMKGVMQDLTTTEFCVQNLEYLETPQYLRKTLFPRSPALRFAGLMNPLDAPHHLRFEEWFDYREGCVINRPTKDKRGSWVNIGLVSQACQVDVQLHENTRVTVKMDQSAPNTLAKYYTGKVVTQNEPFWEKGKYWGYQVRVAHSIKEVFDNGPWKYDLKIGDSQKRESKAVDDVNW